MENSKKNLKDLTLEELEDDILKLGHKKFRGKQIYQWFHKNIESFQQMKNIPKDLIDILDENYSLGVFEIVEKQQSKIDGTIKYLFELNDGQRIETVFMKYKHGNSLCISSQAGCKMGCTFCASGLLGLNRNLTAGEMLEQVLKVQRDTLEKIDNIVVMGTGEPFDNYENLSKFLKLLNHKEGLNLSARNVTVSTCGLVPYIEKFGDDFKQVNLAISLHAVDDEKRSSNMPVNKKYSIKDVLDACRRYIRKTNRRITFEYALIKDENDSIYEAEKLAELLKGMNCHVNLIPLNNINESSKKSSNKSSSIKFKEYLENKNIQVTIRRELGSDIDAACGQLRLKSER